MAGFIAIAVQNHVGQGFFHAEVDGETSILPEAVAIGDRLNPWLDAAQFGQAAVQLKPVLRIVHKGIRLPMGGVSLVRMRLRFR